MKRGELFGSRTVSAETTLEWRQIPDAEGKGLKCEINYYQYDSQCVSIKSRNGGYLSLDPIKC